MQEIEDIWAALEHMFDMPIVRHGYTDYSRDFEIVWEIPSNASGPGAGMRYSYLFRACAMAEYEVTLHPGMFPLDDRFIDYDRWLAAGEPSGYVWGVKWADNYPGARYIYDSPRAATWSERLGTSMHEVVVQASPLRLALVFHDLVVQSLGPASPQASA